jgi:SulP family sulfate permease
MFALHNAYRMGLLQRKYWIRNIVSGVIVGVVALPLAMAFAIASGVKPEQGIYTAIIGGLVVSIFGGSQVQIAGPTGAFIVILSGIVSLYGVDGLQIATVMAGLILVALGITKLGVLIKFIPAPVIIGFTSGIGVIIWVGQWRDFFGLPTITGQHFHEKLWHLIEVFPQLNLTTTALAIFSLLLILFTSKLPLIKRIPGPLIALIVATTIQGLFEFQDIATIGTAFGGIPQGLPSFQIPEITINKVIMLIGPAFTIAMLGSIESLLSAVVADGMAGTKHDSNQELIGQGIANIVIPFFGGFAATGAIARTATNIRNGGNSPLSGIFHSITLVLIILLLSPLAMHVPLATLAAILFVVAWNMSEVHHFIRMIKTAPRADVAILLITFILTVFSDLVIAVNIGVIIAILHFMKRMAASVDIQKMSDEELNKELDLITGTPLPNNILVYSIEGPFFFAAIDNFDRALAYTHSDPDVLILRLRWVPFIDITGLQAIEETIRDLHARNIRVILVGANQRVSNKMHKAGIVALVGSENIFKELSDAIHDCLTTDKTK